MVFLTASDLTQLWQNIDQDEPYNWPKKRPNKSAIRLAELTGSALDVSDRDELSKVLGPMLVSANRHSVARWIISDWGGIRGLSDDSIRALLEGLGDYSDGSVDHFINSVGCKRVSSWSKLLAFRDGRRWAIYDSRTAVALNAASVKIAGCNLFFEMPFSQNNTIKSYRTRLMSRKRQGSVLGYADYLQVLESLRAHRNLETIGSVEKALFANAEKIVPP